MSEQSGGATPNGQSANDVRLFWACFFSIVATAFGFAIRGQVIGEWQTQFNLTETEKGALNGVGLWPFAISIVLFSLIIDKIGYGISMVFAFACHIGSTIMIITASSADMLFWGTFIGALGNGTVEAVANPAVATMFSREKTKWLNILHAGWPGGLMLGGALALLLGLMGEVGWQVKMSLIFLPVLAYGIMMLGCKFPVHERVAAGVSYKDMLKETGFIPVWIVVALMVRELGSNVFHVGNAVQIGVGLVIGIGYAIYVQSPGRPMFIFLVLIMLLLATTELGTDGWVTDLMTPIMGKYAGFLLVYTSLIMMVLRFFAGPIVHRISPLGLLALSAAIAAGGLVLLSGASNIGILLAATLYACGKTFFWPTTLGVVSERFPKGGAVAMNLIAGVGMLGVGIVGMPFIGKIQDSSISRSIEAKDSALHAKVMGETKVDVFGSTRGVDTEKLKALPQAEHDVVVKIQDEAKQSALATIAVLPGIMLACYLALILYFKSIGGYKIEQLGDH